MRPIQRPNIDEAKLGCDGISCLFDKMPEFTLSIIGIHSILSLWIGIVLTVIPVITPLPCRPGIQTPGDSHLHRKKHYSGFKQSKWPNIGPWIQELRMRKRRGKRPWDWPGRLSLCSLYSAYHLAHSCTSITTRVTCEDVSFWDCQPCWE